MTIKRIGAGPRMSQAVVHGDTVYLVGLTASNPVPSVAKQTKQILAQIDKLLKANIWLSDIRTFDEMNSVWDTWVAKGGAPARATVESRLAGDKYLVEIMVTAAL